MVSLEHIVHVSPTSLRVRVCLYVQQVHHGHDGHEEIFYWQEGKYTGI